MFDVTNPSHVITLRSRLSNERLSSYDRITSGRHAETLSLYEWNTAISAAFYASLQCLEVVLRNALDRELTRWHASLDRRGFWYDDPAGVLDIRRRQDITEARRRIRLARRPVTPGRIVSELSFGFWRYLLTSRYEGSLWTPALRHAFPGLRPPRRKDVSARVARLHQLRNQLAHHKAIYDRDLQADYADLLFVVGAICPRTRAWIDQTSTVELVLAQRPAMISPN
ncbi:MAG TPA: hypothetical protein VE465_25380 [Streptosporangiaceae bacterium]|nr:hypothetical protein [Streptosporangiaceae bacterium]